MTTLQELSMVVLADDAPGPAQGQWTYGDYAAIPSDGLWYEIIDGVLYMSPAPGTGHQPAAGLIFYFLMQHIQFAGNGCVFAAPVDVELAPGTVVQPDVVVVLNANAGIITPSRIVGTPDLVVEVASPGTAGYDRREKQDAYARAGVAEYWIADPNARAVELLRLNGAAYKSLGVFINNALLPSVVAQGMPTKVEQFFV
ncbi:MAG: Uma2 family endonuclease [Chloroflexales bacterium]|nr:Uma2 family endonuclease [Chloroflexales bacterium]